MEVVRYDRTWTLDGPRGVCVLYSTSNIIIDMRTTLRYTVSKPYCTATGCFSSHVWLDPSGAQTESTLA